ncbi:MAG: hypothetical protein VYA55_17565 [Pseudomonadota bacterium]|nr:hypothetical protein [Pseudomonadota bacterium]
MTNLRLFLMAGLILVVAACSSTHPVQTSTPQQSKKPIDFKSLLPSQPPLDDETVRKFVDAVFSDCKEQVGNDDVYCTCYADGMNTIAKNKTKIRYPHASENEKSLLGLVTIFNTVVFNDCERIRSLAEPDMELPEPGQRILEQYSNELLTPGNRLTIKPKLELGYEFVMMPLKKDGTLGSSSMWRRLIEIEDNTLGFAYVGTDQRIPKRPSIRVRQGMEYERSMVDDKQFKESRDYRCLFELGVCSFGGEKTGERFIKVRTVFKNGVWFSRSPANGSATKTLVLIIKDDGLPLYKATIYETGLRNQSVRLER